LLFYDIQLKVLNIKLLTAIHIRIDN